MHTGFLWLFRFITFSILQQNKKGDTRRPQDIRLFLLGVGVAGFVAVLRLLVRDLA